MQDNFIDSTFEDMELNATVVQKLHQQFPITVFEETVKSGALELKHSADRVIQKYRTQYSNLITFTEKDSYFKNTLVHMETAYKKVITQLTQRPKPYESWVDAEVYRRMKSNGFRTTVLFYMSTGLIYENK